MLWTYRVGRRYGQVVEVDVLSVEWSHRGDGAGARVHGERVPQVPAAHLEEQRRGSSDIQVLHQSPGVLVLQDLHRERLLREPEHHAEM